MLVDGRPEPIFALIAFVVAAALAWLMVPTAEGIARRIGAIDYPNERSLHTVPTPKLSGLAILIAVVIGGTLFLPWVPLTRAILGGAIAIALVGVADDIWDLSAAPKLLGQAAAAAIPVFSGVQVASFALPFLGRIDLASVDLLSAPFAGNVRLSHLLTIAGIVAVINIINLIDGVDGLAAGVCVICATTLAVVALSLSRTSAAVIAALTAGGALGFLRHGFPPASSFMGDTGSNLLGYLLGAIAVQGALKTNAVVALFFPLVILAVPIFDTGFVIAKRIKYRRPIYRADRWHLHHRMADIGFSQRRTLAYLYGWALVMAGLALALRFVPYSDDRGNFDAAWAAVMIGCLLLAAAASVYLVITLEILKLRRKRSRDLADARGAPVADAEVDEGVARELETGSFATVDPETGEWAEIEPETGEFETVEDPR
ncbi:MAG: undecaprenyl/decaprenyl-phosphate alpha-N-acetylglucosaminyl 1-phosphate transferase [Solirubrobacterales bacterium]|jgi:UDP-GlcNAc:undecaprenyl-phosphate GlcNAc-1-phosphate transferase|nr:undecaprenyl/decaprenyl-phosphate alpha-N-acetylglucosaminyl 1-phosphate transferase [Solirubrobacterales bacterium]